jgi:hypothetical protein
MAERVNQIVRLYDPIPIHRQARDFPASLFQFGANACNGRMLDRRSDYVPAMSDRSFAQAADRKVIRFSTA